MTRYTNKQNLPRPFVVGSILAKESYTGNEPDVFRTASQLVNPPQVVLLEQRHDAEIEVDVSSLAYAVLGTAFHKLMEDACTLTRKSVTVRQAEILHELLGDDWMEQIESMGVTEERLYDTIKTCHPMGNDDPVIPNAFRISGQFDYMPQHDILIDYKLLSVWEWIHGLNPDKTAQLNVLAHLCRANGLPVKRLFILAMFRDWSLSRARTKPEGEYPPAQVMVLPVDLWLPEVAADYVRERVELHARAEAGELVECSSEERWARDEAWAVMREGRKTAVKLFRKSEYGEKALEAANNWASIQDDASKLRIEHRPGESVRCLDYCNAAPFCEQWKSMQGS